MATGGRLNGHREGSRSRIDRRTGTSCLPQLCTDRNLLLGFIGLQTGEITRDQLVAAFSVGTFNKHRPQDEILLEHGAVNAETHVSLTATELALLLGGIELACAKRRERYRRTTRTGLPVSASL